MRVSAILGIGLVLSVPLSASAQEAWTAEQQEVWAFELRCARMSSAERVANCFHEGYSGWYAGDPVPADLAAIRIAQPYWEDWTFVSARPLSIKVIGNVAIVHYMAQWAQPGDGGTPTLTWQRWTDIALKEGDQWRWIADAGGEVTLFRGK